MTRIELIGQRFGSLVVVGELPRRVRPSGQKARYFTCVCDCGTTIECCLGQLRSGHTETCGCARRAATVARNTTHGLSKDYPAEYRTWKGMRRRCNNSGGPDAKRYHERGIRVCERWNSFAAFLDDMGPRPSAGHSIDRWPDRDGAYGPGNCRWADATEQSRNRDIVIVVDCGDEKLHVSDIAARTGIKPKTLYARLRAGWSGAMLLSPVRSGGIA